MLHWMKKEDDNETKFLGVIIDNKLNWSPHIMHISKKIAEGIGIILKARKVFDNETLFSLYYTFIYPYLNYCIHVWGKAYDTHLHHLIVLQNKAIRIINGIPPRTNVDNLYVMHNILSVKRLYSYNVGLFMYKYSNQLFPDVFKNLFTKLADVQEYNTRNASTQHVYVCFQGTTRGQNTLNYCGARIWNYILDNVDSKCAIIQETHPKIVLVFKRWPHYMIQQYLMHGSVNGNAAFFVYRCVNMYMYMHVCAIWGIYVDIHVHERKCFILEDTPALCTVSVLHSQNNLLCIIDIRAHKPLWLQAPFARFYIFHVYQFYYFCSLRKSFVHELYVTWQ